MGSRLATSSVRVRQRIRPRRRIRFVVTALSCLSIVVVGTLLRKPAREDWGWVNSGDYRFVQVNPDGSLRVASLLPNNSSKSRGRRRQFFGGTDVDPFQPHQDPLQVDVYWLGVQMLNTEQAVQWLVKRFQDVDQLSIRLDKRRLNPNGQLEAYLFVGDELVNAQLVAEGLANEATHPSDFAGIARRIRQAKPH